MKTTSVRVVSLPSRIYAAELPKTNGSALYINGLHIEMRTQIIDQIEDHGGEKFHVMLIETKRPKDVENIL